MTRVGITSAWAFVLWVSFAKLCLAESIEFGSQVEVIISEQASRSQEVVFYQPHRQANSYFFSYHQGLTPTCRWLSKRLTLLKSWLDSVHQPPYPAGQFILQQEWFKRQRDWIQQGCEANLR